MLAIAEGIASDRRLFMKGKVKGRLKS